MADDLRTLTGAQRALAIADRRGKVAALLAKGRTLREAAEDLGLTFGQVNAAYRAITREVDRSILRDTSKHRARCLAKVLHLQREAWLTLERVRAGAVEKSGSVGEVAGSKIAVGATSVKQKSAFAAEVKAIDTIRKLYEDERTILGIRVDEKPDTSVPEGGTTVNVAQGIVIVNDAQLADNVPWLSTIAAGVARQGVGVLPPGTPDSVIEAEAVKKGGE